MKKYFGLLLLAVLAGLSACGQHDAIKLGFLSGQTGPFADLGKAGLNGAILAVEERNAQGGLAGRPITLLIGDDEHDRTKAGRALQALIDADVTAIIGPMTSSMATSLVTAANEAKIVLMGGTVVTDQLSGKDDYFFRAIAPTNYYAAYSANIHHQQHQPRQVTVVFDAANRDYAENWAKNYVAELQRLDGVATSVIEIDSRTAPNLMALANQIMASNPDHVSFSVSARTAATLMRSIRSKHENVHFSLSAWAANQLLLELAGPAAEGSWVEQYHDLFDQSASYTRFVANYQTRFRQHPDYAAVIAYDATKLVLDSLAINPHKDALKKTLLQKRDFVGLQGPITLDQFGDAARRAYTTVVKDGQFSRLEK